MTDRVFRILLIADLALAFLLGLVAVVLAWPRRSYRRIWG